MAIRNNRINVQTRTYNCRDNEYFQYPSLAVTSSMSSQSKTNQHDILEVVFPIKQLSIRCEFQTESPLHKQFNVNYTLTFLSKPRQNTDNHFAIRTDQEQSFVYKN